MNLNRDRIACWSLRGMLLLASAAHPLLAHGVMYRAIDIGSLPGGDDGNTLNGLNNLGQVVGISSTAAGPHAFFWDPTGGIQDLGDLPGGADSSSATSINDAGVVVGQSSAGDAGTHAFRWTSAGGLQDLHILVGGLADGFSDAASINSAGQLVGRRSIVDAMGGGWEAFLLNSVDSLTVIGDLPDGLARGTPADINSLGEVAGTGNSRGTLNGPQPFVWNSVDGIAPIDDPAFQGRGINDAGVVVGYDYFLRAFTWDKATGLHELAGDLPGGGQGSQALAINSAGLIVGNGSGTGGTRAALWDPAEGMLDLNLLLATPLTNWRLTSATAISETGQILSQATYTGAGTIASRGFLLTPVPEPHSGVCMALGLTVFCWSRARLVTKKAG